jgi:Carbohydrate binding module (family 6)/Glycosyl hydrolase family 26
MKSLITKLMLVALSGLAALAHAAANDSAEAMKKAKFLPADGKTLLFVGQDIDAVNGYTRGTQHVPAGITVYTSLRALDGVYARNHGQNEGPQDWNSVKVAYPNSALAVGLYLVGQLDAVVDGELDSNIDRLADELQSFNRPVFLRIGYEADGSWNSYNPEKYKAAWRHIVQRLRAKKADRIATVWQVVGICGPTPEAWYPGDDIVDWTGFSLFMTLPGCPGKVQDLIDDLHEKGKPIMIAESAPVAYAIADGTYNGASSKVSPDTLQKREPDEIWQGWFQKYFDLIERNKDSVKAVSYINQHWKLYKTWDCAAPNDDGERRCPSTYWGDTRVEANPKIQAEWMAAIKSPQLLASGNAQLFGKIQGYVPAAVPMAKGPHNPGGDPVDIPVTIDVEAYDRGGQGVGYSDTTPLNSGYAADGNLMWRANEGVDIVRITEPGFVADGSDKHAVGDTQSGEWLEYTVNAAQAGSFEFAVQVASKGKGGAFTLAVDGQAVGAKMQVPDTGSATKFQSIKVGAVNLTAGKHVLRLSIVDTGSGNGGKSSGNFDDIEIKALGK